MNNEIKELSADPYDDQLMENFCSYISLSQKKIEKVEKIYNKKIVPKSISALGLDLIIVFHKLKMHYQNLIDIHKDTWIITYLMVKKWSKKQKESNQRCQREKKKTFKI